MDKLRFVFVFLSFAAYFIISFVNKKLLVRKPADTQAALLGKLTLANIISLALCELPALFGFVLFLCSGNPTRLFPPLNPVVTIILRLFPQIQFLVKLVPGHRKDSLIMRVSHLGPNRLLAQSKPCN